MLNVVLVMVGGHCVGHPIPARPETLIEEASKFLVVLELSMMRGAARAKDPHFEAEKREMKVSPSPSDPFEHPQFR